MSAATLPGTIELDGVIELLRCPQYQSGWSAADIKVTYSPETWRLPTEFAHLREEWERLHPHERSDPKVALREILLDSDHALVCRLQSSAWREVRPLHEAPPLDDNSLFRRRANGYEMLLPNIGVVHVIAATCDGWLLVIRRSDSVHYHPGSWSATYEEGLAPEDLDGDAVFQRAARRGLAEELAAQADTMSLEAFRVVSIVLERPLGNPAVVVVANLPIPQRDLLGRSSSDELDAGSLVAVPIDRGFLRDILIAPVPMLGTRPGRWHPTSRYRLLTALAHFFGEEVAAETLSRIQPGARHDVNSRRHPSPP